MVSFQSNGDQRTLMYEMRSLLSIGSHAIFPNRKYMAVIYAAERYTH